VENTKKTKTYAVSVIEGCEEEKYRWQVEGNKKYLKSSSL
jgi:hypothetical protein